jgi:hypothetical protein
MSIHVIARPDASRVVPHQPHTPHLCFRVEDARETAMTLEEAGIQIWWAGSVTGRRQLWALLAASFAVEVQSEA